MSEVYWGIVAGLVALVATFFVCIQVMYSNAKRPPQAPGGMTDSPSQAGERPRDRDRRAAA
ncbi:MAG: hypothetical protein GDA67_02195 [Nitrospira sp. CR1.3]|nr:hypothetical protein [Nitrospira sp. CR1.3]